MLVAIQEVVASIGSLCGSLERLCEIFLSLTKQLIDQLLSEDFPFLLSSDPSHFFDLVKVLSSKIVAILHFLGVS
jgi:hypothetical protein